MSRVGRGMMGKFRNGLFLFRLELRGACEAASPRAYDAEKKSFVSRHTHLGIRGQN